MPLYLRDGTQPRRARVDCEAAERAIDLMFRTTLRRTHRAQGPAVIDYRGLVSPLGRTVGGVAALGAVTATATLVSAEAAHAEAPAARIAAPAAAAPAALPAAPTPVAIPVAAPANPFAGVTLRQGARGDAVRYLQDALNANGASIAADGVFGRATQDAVRTAQSGGGIAVDGVVGRQTWGVLSGSGQSTPAPSEQASTSTSTGAQLTLRRGDRGEAVRTLQEQLNARGAGIAVDGSFGAGTHGAVRSLQSAAGISVDGVVGARTRSALTDESVRITSGSSARSTSGSSSDSAPSASSDSSGDAIVATARQYLGVPYLWGGTTPNGFDCSGLVQYVYKKNGISTPRIAKDQVFGGRIIPQSEARPGDLVGFTGNNYGHIGIYLGNGRILDASSKGRPVQERAIWSAPHVFVTYR